MTDFERDMAIFWAMWGGAVALLVFGEISYWMGRPRKAAK